MKGSSIPTSLMMMQKLNALSTHGNQIAIKRGSKLVVDSASSGQNDEKIGKAAYLSTTALPRRETSSSSMFRNGGATTGGGKKGTGAGIVSGGGQLQSTTLDKLLTHLNNKN